VFRRIGVFGVVCALLGAVGGCDMSVKPVATKGKVTFKGEALAGASVSFMPASEKGQIAAASTNNSGEFELTTTGKPGAIPGDYLVAISKTESIAPASTPGAKLEDMAKAYASKAKERTDVRAKQPKSLIPIKYADPKQSGLKATVTTDPAKNVFEFNLTEQ